jgi:iron complex transport system ATP-binding protein
MPCANATGICCNPRTSTRHPAGNHDDTGNGDKENGRVSLEHVENCCHMNEPNDEFAFFENASIWRGGHCIFTNLNLHIKKGERVAIIGPNGSGKSTLLKAMNREIYPATGNGGIGRMFGRSDGNVWNLRQRIGFVSDEIERAYTAHTTVIDTIASGFFASVGVHGTLSRRLTQSHREAALIQLEAQGLLSLKHRTLRDLSSGERRRCFLARALVHAPEALILDEPTAGLDFNARFELLHSIEGVDTQTLLFVTHELNDIPRTVDRVLLLRNGSIVADGPKSVTLTSEVLSRVYERGIELVKLRDRYFALPAESPKTVKPNPKTVI